MIENTVAKLKSLKPSKEFFVGVDSDGCVFDTMAVKQVDCFSPNTVECFGLQIVDHLVRETSEFVGLYSIWRGSNRFPGLIRTMEMLGQRPEVVDSCVLLPDTSALRAWVEGEKNLSNDTLKAYMAENPDPFLSAVYDWSLAVNATIEARVKGVGPFPMVRECLERMRAGADMVVVSQTPVEALEREWLEHGMREMMDLICGQEHGTKGEHLTLGAGGKYPPANILMLGDAPGDWRAAQEAGCLFFPINPGNEATSWKHLHDEGLDRFFEGRFDAEYQKALVKDFLGRLPECPPWETL